MEKKAYHDLYDLEEKHWWFLGRRKIINDFLKRFSSNPSDALDVGCGTGLNSKMLEQFTNDVLSVDISDEAIKFAKEKNPDLNIVKGDFLIVNFQKKFDVIAMFDVLEHFDNDSMVINKVSQLLNKDGIMIITVPAYSFLWSEHDELAHHKKRYRKKELLDLFESNGLKVVKISYYNFFLFPIISFIRILKRVLNVRSEKSDFHLGSNTTNKFLEKLFSFERYFLRYINFPFGVSIIAVAKKI